jgi:HEAT repeat protein
VRTNAAESLGFFSDESKRSVPPLLERLSDSDIGVRRATILALGRVGKGDEKVQAHLAKFIDDTDHLVKLDAIIAVAGIGGLDDSTIPVLLSALGNKDEATAKAAGRVLSDVAVKDPEKVLPGLVQVLDRKEQSSLVNALRVLKRMRSRASSTLPKIVALYDEVKPVDRIEVIEALEAIDAKGDHAIPVLIKALKGPDPQDRKDALLSILRFRSRSDEFIGPLADSLNDSDPENRILAIGIIRGLGEKGSAAIPKLIALIDDPDVSVRTKAIGALSSFEADQKVFEGLQKAMRDSDTQVRMATIGTLRRVGVADPEKAIEILQQALTTESNDPTKRAISSALESLKKPPPHASGSPK